MGVIKAVFYPSKERKWGKEVDFGHFYQLIELNFLNVHKTSIKGMIVFFGEPNRMCQFSPRLYITALSNSASLSSLKLIF